MSCSSGCSVCSWPLATTLESQDESLTGFAQQSRDKAQLEFDDFAMEDFMARLAFAGCQRWGLVIELLIEAFGLALLKGDKVCKIDHFSKAFSNITSAPLGYSSFTVPNYRDHFDQDKLLEMYEKTRQKKAPQSKYPASEGDSERPASCGPFFLPFFQRVCMVMVRACMDMTY